MKVAHHRQAAIATSTSLSIVRVWFVVRSAKHALQSRVGTEFTWCRGSCTNADSLHLAHCIAAGSAHKECDGCAAALERTFLAWMHMAVTLGGVMTALVGFTYTDEDDPDSPYRRASRTHSRLPPTSDTFTWRNDLLCLCVEERRRKTSRHLRSIHADRSCCL